MRGLPFPAEALYNREQSLDFGSPGPGANGVGIPPFNDAVPLDPALSGPRSAPAFFSHVTSVNGVNGHVQQQGDPMQQPYPVSPSYPFGMYPQGPEGDPFAPPPHFFPGPPLRSTTDGRSEMSQKPVKRSKRKPRREEECGFCAGNGSKNESKEPERLATCSDCGRSGHPSCMELGAIGETLRSYPWKCVECKTCEICNEKGDDARILFCDNCDRGWHMYCLDPPLDQNPEGSWFCPQCPVPPESPGSLAIASELQIVSGQSSTEPKIAPELQIDPALQMETENPMEIDPALREESVAASTAPSEAPRQSRPKSRKSAVKDRKGKGRALILSEDEEEEQVEVEVEEVEEDENEMFPPASAPRGRASLNSRRKSTARTRRTSESIPDDVEAPSPPLRPQKRMKLSVRSPSPPPRQRQSVRPKVVVRLRLPGKGKGREEEEEEEPKKGMFDEILDERERDASKTTILTGDKERFERARVTAESKLLPQRTLEPIDLSTLPGPSSGRFPLRSAVHQLQQQHTQTLLTSPNLSSPSPSTPGPPHTHSKSDPNALRIRTIRFGPWDIQTWYDAPFPEEFSNIPDGRLWICEFCLKYMKSRFGAQRHRLKCKCRHPPGDEIYRDGSVSIFEVDGRKNKIYCQHLCLLSKMFLDHKSLFYDVEPFLFYVITEVDDIGARFVGYFSKEKRSSKDLNLSCIMTLPVRQRQGWGNLLIDFSYLLSRKEHKVGTPERPLSALGAIGYKKYWTLAVMRYLNYAPSNPRLEDISLATGMTLEDIYLTLVQQNMITVHEGPSSPVRPSPGRSVKVNRSRKNGLARRNLQKVQPADEDKSSKPFAPPTSYEIQWDPDEVRQFLGEWNAKGYQTLRSEKLKWTPFLLSRADKLATPLEDVLTTTPVDVENTPTTPGPRASEIRDTAASASGSATASTTALDAADAPTTASLVTPISESGLDASSNTASGTEHADTNSSAVGTEHPPPSSDSERHVSELEGSPTPSPSPPPVLQPKPRSINGLEALAAVAFAVSKANPVDVRRRSSTILPLSVDTSKNGWGQNALNGSPRKSFPHTFSEDSPLTALPESRSRRFDAKAEDTSSLLDVGMKSDVNDAQTPRLARPDIHPVIVPKPDQADGPGSRPPITQRISIEKDAELAARLAREESVQRRSLRSASISLSATPTLPFRESRSKETRKRQKTQSVRESSPPTPISPDRPTTRRQAQALAIETAKANAGRMTRRQSSRLAGTGSVVGENDSVSVSGARAYKRSTRLNGASKSVAPQSPAKIARELVSQRNGTRKGRTTRSSRRGRSPDDVSASGERAGGEEDEVDAEGESDVDAEREAVVAVAAPSNGDVSMDEQDRLSVDDRTKNGANGTSGKPNGRRYDEDCGATPTDTAGFVQKVEPEEAKVDMTVDVEDEDMDAEGEPDDEDADGEPDPDAFL